MLRKENGLTQEQFAEIICVSNRTISRWENGNNMPDIDVLIELSDYYEVDLREILNGERKSEKVDKETKEVVLEAVEYTNNTSERYTKRVNQLLLVGAILWFISQLINHTDLTKINYLSSISNFQKGQHVAW